MEHLLPGAWDILCREKMERLSLREVFVVSGFKKTDMIGKMFVSNP